MTLDLHSADFVTNHNRAECASRRKREKILDGVWRSREVTVCEIETKWVPDAWLGQRRRMRVSRMWPVWHGESPGGRDQQSAGAVDQKHGRWVYKMTTGIQGPYCVYTWKPGVSLNRTPANATRFAGTDAAVDRILACVRDDSEVAICSKLPMCSEKSA